MPVRWSAHARPRAGLARVVVDDNSHTNDCSTPSACDRQTCRGDAVDSASTGYSAVAGTLHPSPVTTGPTASRARVPPVSQIGAPAGARPRRSAGREGEVTWVWREPAA